MDQVKAFLEKHVQWIALGVGGLVFMWAVWAYVIDPASIVVEVDKQMAGPGTVDDRILNGSAADLQGKIEGPPGVVPDPPDLNLVFEENWRLPATTRLIAAGKAAPVGPLPPVDELGSANPNTKVAVAPSIPPMIVTGVGSGLAFVNVPGPDGTPGQNEDITFSVVRFEVPMAALRTKFGAVGLAPNIANTSILDARLVRQRRMPDGSWSEQTEIPLLRNSTRDAMPEESATLQAKVDYAQFAREYPELVAQPPFYELVAGDDPQALGFGDDAPVERDDPADGGPGLDENDPPRDGGQGDPGIGGGVGDPLPGGDPSGGTGDIRIRQDGDSGRGGGGGQRRGDSGRYYPPTQGTPPSDGGPEDQPGAEDDSGPPRYSSGPLAGDFTPGSYGSNIECWAFDETAIPGETYRYNVVYSLRNPVFNTENIAENAELEQQLALTVAIDTPEWNSQWSDPVTVEPLSAWFMKSVLPGPEGLVQFDVYRWQEGQWQQKTFRVGPGDEIGAQEDGIDYRTGRVLVDVRDDLTPGQRQKIAVLMDREGRFTQHDASDDDSEEAQRFQDLLAAG